VGVREQRQTALPGVARPTSTLLFLFHFALQQQMDKVEILIVVVELRWMRKAEQMTDKAELFEFHYTKFFQAMRDREREDKFDV
jgi:hypothetical protein